MNDDGVDDIIFSAPRDDANAVGDDSNSSTWNTGASYVLLGSEDPLPAVLTVQTLSTVGGFTIAGDERNLGIGLTLAPAGDFDGDGVNDILVGAPTRVFGGETYLILGDDQLGAADIDVSASGAGIRAYSSERATELGVAIDGIGDVNGDGFDDIFLGASYLSGSTYDPEIGGFTGDDGVDYIVFGGSNFFEEPIDLTNLDGSDGVVVRGGDGRHSSRDTRGVSGIGDFNGDGVDDFVVGSGKFDTDDRYNNGQAYIVFGDEDGFDPEIKLADLDGSNGFVVIGADYNQRLGLNVSAAGDLDGDGYDDVIVSGTGGPFYAGPSYVIFGSSGVSKPSIDIQDFVAFPYVRYEGVTEFNAEAGDVAYGGDINGDGFDDILLGSYTYQSSDGHNAGATYVVYGSADLRDRWIVAVDDKGAGFETAFDTAITTHNVLTNDQTEDAGDSPQLLSMDTSFTLGLVTNNGDGTFEYDPNGAFDYLKPGQSATDKFYYDVSDGDSAYSTGAVLITVQRSNTAPVAADVAGATNEDAPAEFQVLQLASDPDGQELSITAASAEHGTVSITADGALSYTPDANFHGADVISYTISDGQLTDNGQIDVTVASQNDAPVAADLAGATNEDTSAVFQVLNSASDVDGPALSITAASAEHGTVSITADGALSYTPDANFNGADVISYTVLDGQLTDDGQVDVAVAPQDDAPVAADLTGATNEDTPAEFQVLQLASDPDGQELSITAASAEHGTVSITADGALSYTPDANFHGADVISYTISDGQLTDNGRIDVTVASQNDAPSLSPVEIQGGLAENTVLGAVVAKLSGLDVEGDPLNFEIVRQSQDGDAPWFEIQGDELRVANELDYEKAATATVEVRASDGQDYSASQTLEIPVLDVPEAIFLDDAGGVFVQTDEPELLVRGGQGADQIIGGATRDVFEGDLGDDTIRGHGDADSLSGGAGNDRLIGGDGGDTISGGNGADVVRGGAGADEISVGRGDDVVRGSKGADIISGGAGDDHLMGKAGQDEIYGGAGDDTLRGDIASDSLDGGNGDDLIIGGLGADTLVGGRGDDTMRGDAGQDVFKFREGDAGSDRIADFRLGQDQIDLRGVINDLSELEIEQNGASAVLRAGKIEITLVGVVADDLDEGDFML